MRQCLQRRMLLHHQHQPLVNVLDPTEHILAPRGPEGEAGTP
jgi:hypothetical protein